MVHCRLPGRAAVIQWWPKSWRAGANYVTGTEAGRPLIGERISCLEAPIEESDLRVSIIAFWVSFGVTFAQSSRPDIPKAWDQEQLESMELPLVGLGVPPTQISPEDYYQI